MLERPEQFNRVALEFVESLGGRDSESGAADG